MKETNYPQLTTLSDEGFIRVIEQGSGGAFPALLPLKISQGEVTLTYGGFSGSVTGTMRYSRMGNAVTLDFDGASGTSNSTSFTITAGFPDSLRPSSSNRVILARVQNNGGGAQLGLLIITPTGSDPNFRSSMAAANFTASGTKSVQGGTNGTYIL